MLADVVVTAFFGKLELRVLSGFIGDLFLQILGFLGANEVYW
jgi:hypothetical protein